jgi:hypothetical protein
MVVRSDCPGLARAPGDCRCLQADPLSESMSDALSDARPNILLIITDHHAYYGHDRPDGPAPFTLCMPNFERLAEAARASTARTRFRPSARRRGPAC